MTITDSHQFKSGKDVERFLDEYFSNDFEITQTSARQERTLYLGDRIFKHRKTGRKYFVEYKSGIQTFYTGNIFLETISVDSENKPGWLYTCKANFLLYATLLNGFILLFIPKLLREQISQLRRRYPEKATSKGQNEGYNTHGLVVPLNDAKELASKIIPLDRESEEK